MLHLNEEVADWKKPLMSICYGVKGYLLKECKGRAEDKIYREAIFALLIARKTIRVRYPGHNVQWACKHPTL